MWSWSAVRRRFPPPPASSASRSKSARAKMLTACEAALPAEIAVCVAAVADWRPQTLGERKIKKDGGAPAGDRAGREPGHPGAAVEGPAAPPPGDRLRRGDQRPGGQRPAPSSARKGCDWIVANDVSVEGAMGGDENAVAIVSGRRKSSDGSGWPSRRWRRSSRKRIAAQFN